MINGGRKTGEPGEKPSTNNSSTHMSFKLEKQHGVNRSDLNVFVEDS